MSKKAKVKSFKEILSLASKERGKYLLAHIDALKQSLSREEIEAIISSLHDDLVYGNDAKDFAKLSPEEIAAAKRKYWNLNNSKIENIVSGTILEYGQFPSIDRMSSVSKLNENVIRKHLEDLNESKASYYEIQKAKIGLNSLLSYLLQLSYKGDLKAGELYLKYVDRLINQSGRPINEEISIFLPKEYFE